MKKFYYVILSMIAIQKSQFVVGIAQVLVILTPLMQHPLLNGPLKAYQLL